MRSSTYKSVKISKLNLFLAVFASLFFSMALLANEPEPTHNEGGEAHSTEAAPADGEHLTPVADEAHGGAHTSDKFEPGKMILEHIGDSHDWHIVTWNHEHISIPLPVIVYSSEKGIEVFSSSHLAHGHEYKGYRLNEKNKLEAVNADGSINEEAKFTDFSITKNVVSLLVSLTLMLLIFTSVAKSYKRNRNKAPKGLQNAVEALVLFIRDEVAKPSIGPKYKKYVPYLLMIFFFIWINNLMGLIPIAPFGANLSGNIAFTMTLALCTFVITLASSNKYFWQHIFAMPGVPIPVLVILIPIEVMGLFLKPIILTLRLFANMTAGHIIALAFFSLIFIFGAINEYVGLGVSVFSIAFTVFMMALELLVAFLQAYVFTLLSAIYIGGAVEEHHHHDEHEHAHAH